MAEMILRPGLDPSKPYLAKWLSFVAGGQLKKDLDNNAVRCFDGQMTHWLSSPICNQQMAVAGSLNLTEAHCMRPQHENES